VVGALPCWSAWAATRMFAAARCASIGTAAASRYEPCVDVKCISKVKHLFCSVCRKAAQACARQRVSRMRRKCACSLPQPRIPDFDVKQRLCPGGAGTAVDRRAHALPSALPSCASPALLMPSRPKLSHALVTSPCVLNSSPRPLIRPNHFTHTQAALKPAHTLRVHVLVVAAASNHTRPSFYCR
jgi:hypothetical protein